MQEDVLIGLYPRSLEKSVDADFLTYPLRAKFDLGHEKKIIAGWRSWIRLLNA